jgi:hypothetical protein
MNKKLFSLAVLIIFLFAINFVSAGFWDYWSDYKTDTYKETSEYTKTTEFSSSDYYTSRRTKHTISEKTEYYERTRTPTYRYSRYPRYDRYDYHYDSVPYSSWRYKEPYDHDKYRCDYEDDYRRKQCKKGYYYKPRYDYDKGYYNWRW